MKKILKEKENKIKKTFKQFVSFLAAECWDLKKYKEGKYDKKIWNWFNK